jgi:hypothetical protein
MARKAPERNYLFLVTFGRSGSTALQAAINAHPRTVIRGENYLAMRGIQRYIESIACAADRHHSGRPDHPWYGTAKLDADVVRSEMRAHVEQTILRPAKDTLWIGYKEVRFETGYFADSDALLDHLLFLVTFFPGARLLINTRSASSTEASGWWPDNPNAAEVLANTVANLTEVAEDLRRVLGPERVAHLRYEEWSEDAALVTKGLAGLGFPADDPVIQGALGERLTHGRSGSEAS